MVEAVVWNESPSAICSAGLVGRGRWEHTSGKVAWEMFGAPPSGGSDAAPNVGCLMLGTWNGGTDSGPERTADEDVEGAVEGKCLASEEILGLVERTSGMWFKFWNLVKRAEVDVIEAAESCVLAHMPLVAGFRFERWNNRTWEGGPKNFQGDETDILECGCRELWKADATSGLNDRSNASIST
ncbi:Cytosolic sulfotransferase 12 [Frankliniella fusca]|uniref:Cytosolic sulfotransferase 12 n=1 Tax=Frankliniella fusca TaxID=407009 RepID=A0AAE1LP84_9NEOP|nr:Cytosolic sulfotransferase 12 [Frankliniella fusca]